MEKKVKTRSIGQLAKMAGVSVRTLHHYDHIELLTPSFRTAAGYRRYQEQDLLRLQQILFFKELNFPLGEIRNVLDDPDFDQIEALENHRRLLQWQAARLSNLVKTIDKTIQRIAEEAMTMTDKELYEGFTQEQIERYKREARELYEPQVVKETEQRVRRMSKAQWKAVKEEGEEVAHLIAAHMDKDPSNPEVQSLIARHHTWIENFYPASAEVYSGLGQLYAGHEEFRQYYEKLGPNLADFMAAAMAHYADHDLAGSE